MSEEIEKDEYGFTPEGRMNFEDCAELLGMEGEEIEELMECYGGWVSEIFNC